MMNISPRRSAAASPSAEDEAEAAAAWRYAQAQEEKAVVQHFRTALQYPNSQQQRNSSASASAASASLTELVRLVRSAEIRDLDPLFQHQSTALPLTKTPTTLYNLLASLMEHAWKHWSSSKRRRLLGAAYTVVQGIMRVPEFHVPLALKHNQKRISHQTTQPSATRAAVGGAVHTETAPAAFDQDFAAALVARFAEVEHAALQDDREPFQQPRSAAGAAAWTATHAIGRGPLRTAGAEAPRTSATPSNQDNKKHDNNDARDCLPLLTVEDELLALRDTLHLYYSLMVSARPYLLSLMAGAMRAFVTDSESVGAVNLGPRMNQEDAPISAPGISELLSVTSSIVAGFAKPLQQRNLSLLKRFLLPLHRVNGSLPNVPSEPLFGAYQKPLVHIMCEYISADVTLLPTVISYILAAWPGVYHANSLKEVYLLNELEAIIDLRPVQTESVRDIILSGHGNGGSGSASGGGNIAGGRDDECSRGGLLRRVATCVASENHRIAERALQFWRSRKWCDVCASCADVVAATMLPAVIQKGKVHWNQSVNKMRALVLHTLSEVTPPATFERIVVDHWRTNTAGTIAFVKHLLPDGHSGSAGGATAEEGSESTSVSVPVSLGEVKYTNFVFGHDLGTGSFSSVKYAKHINPKILPSRWDEYAVKVMDKALIKAQRCEANVKRETQIMEKLAHPLITRIVGIAENPKFHYLVLEYASAGDLHSCIRSKGSLDVEAVRFLAAEILVALSYVHAAGVVYNDLKPENILLHASGHVKLADFGSARWIANVSSDDRVEGTEDYLAPEIVLGGSSCMSPVSDMWAFACVLYQMLAGRTPEWAKTEAMPFNYHNSSADTAMDTSSDTDGSIAAAAAEKKSAGIRWRRERKLYLSKRSKKDHKRAVRFGNDEDGEDGSVDQRFPEHFPADARAFIEAVLVQDPIRRLGMRRDEATAAVHPNESDASCFQRGPQIAVNVKNLQYVLDYEVIRRHPFFEPIEWHSLCQQEAPAIGGGVVAPVVDAKWARRKNSMLLAPMPEKFSFNDSGTVLPRILEVDSEREGAMDRSTGVSQGAQKDVHTGGQHLLAINPATARGLGALSESQAMKRIRAPMASGRSSRPITGVMPPRAGGVRMMSASSPLGSSAGQQPIRKPLSSLHAGRTFSTGTGGTDRIAE